MRTAGKSGECRKKIVAASVLVIVLAFWMTACGRRGAGTLADGVYLASVQMEGGSGRATIDSPARVEIRDGVCYATVVWSSENYDYMIVDDEKYLNENEGGSSTFTFPIPGFDLPFTVIGDTTAMSVPHEITYTLTFTKKDVDYTSLKNTGQVKLSYATQFQIEELEGYKQITIVSDGRYLLVPEELPVPVHVPEDVVIIRTPVRRGYLVATAAMDLICQLDALDGLAMSGTKEEDWYISEAKAAMQEGTLLYAGKYSAPDYERILDEQCDLAIENTMIYHTPEVKEKLEELGIPVFVERSSYEEHPLGRLEWIRVFGELFGKEKEAAAFFDQQVEELAPVLAKEKSGKTAVFFYVTSNGMVNVRKPGDYISKMMELAGGRYALADLPVEEENALSTMKLQWEEFYALAKDADILIYNSTIEGELHTMDDLMQINPLFAEFRAVKEDQVYCTTSNFFQETTGTCRFIEDLNQVFTGEKSGEFSYLKRLGE